MSIVDSFKHLPDSCGVQDDTLNLHVVSKQVYIFYLLSNSCHFAVIFTLHWGVKNGHKQLRKHFDKNNK